MEPTAWLIPVYHLCVTAITLSKGKTTRPLLVVLHRRVCIQLFRVYWTALNSKTEQLLSV